MEKRNIREKDVANNQISCHSKLDLESSTLAVLESKTINDMRGRSRIKYGMTSLFNNGKHIESSPTQRGSMQTVKDVFICPPCGESVAQATKEGQNRKKSLWPLLPRLTAVLPPQGREITTRGFTLIELLVVVLIIGILAAVALPQYQMTTDKVRFLQAMTFMESTWRAQQAYHAAHGDWANNFNKLDIDFPEGYKNQNCWTYSLYGGCVVRFGKGTEMAMVDYIIMWDSGQRQCRVNPADNKRGNAFCRHITGQQEGSLGGVYSVYNFK